MRAFVITVMLWMFAASRVSGADVIGAIAFDVSTSTTLVAVSQTAGMQPKVFELGGEAPRIVMDWERAKVGFETGGLTQLKGYGHVRSIRYAEHGQTGLRVVLDLLPGSSLQTHTVKSNKLVITVIGKPLEIIVPPAAAAPTKAEMRVASFPYPRLKPNTTQKKAVKRRPIIVIDPGHGGRDPGAIGSKGTYEKSVTLKAALELKRQLGASGRYDVILTRVNDQYIEHEERIRIARAGQGDLFISIHADSIKSRKIRGASVYTLSDKSKKRSKGIVHSQNWIMDIDLTEQSDSVGDILVDLAQRKTSTQSEQFADLLVANLSGSTRLIGNTHRRAGYFVLLAPDVPAVLLELGFISNPQDEALLKSAAHRKKVMRSVVTAINAYFAHQKS